LTDQLITIIQEQSKVARTVKVVEDRREQIITAAMEVFARKGYNQASNKDIARQAGITPGLIYHYFESKEALLKAIFETRTPLRLFRSFPPEMLDLPPEKLLRFLVQQMLAIVENENFVQLVRIYLPEAIYNPQAALLGNTAISEAIHFVENYLAARMSTGELRQVDPGLVTQFLLGSVMDLVLRRQVLKDPVTLQYTQEQIVDSVVDLVLQGLARRG
jgi:AcrR family transcriptional regulator